MDWKPINEEQILELINCARRRLTFAEKHFWDAIAIPPVKWQQHPYGDTGGGFWVVAVIGKTVVWYNDIEDGFNISRYESSGVIPDSEYWCNQDELEWPVRSLLRVVQTGEPVAGRFSPPIEGEFQA